MEHAVIFVVCKCSYNSAMLQLYLQRDIWNIIFKIKHKLCMAPGSAHSPPQ
jgi:hypothetical protein